MFPAVDKNEAAQEELDTILVMQFRFKVRPHPTIVVAAALFSAFATTPAPSQESAKFTARSELVTVPVVVTDKSGQHVHNLKKEDFLLLEDGKEQKIAVFDEIEKPANKIVPPATKQPNQFSNASVENSAPTRLTIVALDMVNTPFEDQSYAKKQLLKFLTEAIDGSQPTSLLVIRRSGMRVIQDFTTDPQILVAALQKLQGERQPLDPTEVEALPSGSDPLTQALRALMEMERASEQEMESLERRSAVITTMRAIQQIAQSCAGLPGRKALIWAGAGFPFSINETGMVLKETGARLSYGSEMLPLYEKTWKLLNQAQLAVYPVDVRGLVNSSFVGADIGRPEDDAVAHAHWQHMDTLSTFQIMAEATGGRAFYNTNDLKAAFHKASEDNASYYMLGYYLDRHGKKPGWHKLGVKVHHSGLETRARTGFFLTQEGPEQNDKAEMEMALSSPLNYTAIPITAQYEETVPAPEKGKKKVVFLLSMPANFAIIDEDDSNHVLVEFAAVARDGTGAAVGEMSKTLDGHLKPDSLKQVREHGMDYHGSLDVAPGEYTVHFAVEDRLSGRIGSLTTPLKVAP